jgi:uncharacterized MAPEG superfamily protein
LTIAHWCLLVACFLPIVCTGIAKAGMFGVPAREGGYDNADPRAWLARQTGHRARANAAQANSFEALPLFIAAVLVAHQVQGPSAFVDALALAFIALRLTYIVMYVTDRALARSAVWTLGYGVCIAIFLSPLYR